MTRLLPPALRRLLAVLDPYRGWMFGGAALALLTALAALGLMAVSGWFIAAMALAGLSGAAINYFSPAAAIRAFAILRSGGRYGDRLVTHEATLRGLSGLRAWLFRRLIPLAPARLSALRSGELFARLRADIDALEHFYLAVLVPAAVALLSLALVLVLGVIVLPGAALVLLIGALLAGVLLPAWAHRRAALDAAQAVLDAAALRGLLLDALRGHAELLAWGGVAAHAARIDALAARLDARRARIEVLQALGGGMVGLLAQLVVLGILVFGLAAVHGGTLAPPLLVMLALLALALFEVIAPLPEALAQWQATLTAAARVFDLADTPPAFIEPEICASLPAAVEIVFENVHLRYADAAPWALAGVDLQLAAGARVAIVGASGAGKSSLLSALLKFYPLQQGRIMLGGQPLDALQGDVLRRHIAVISQQTTLFNLSLLDNLLLAAPEATAAQIERAVNQAQMDAFVAGLPQGYDTVLGEAGALVSGGEARRIAIARALLQDAPVLVLDEPTEGLDARTARDLYAALDVAARGRTLLLITHRLGGLAHLVDEVAVMAAGRIRERVPVAQYLQRRAR
ncbi:thiol reductant ABC exporter subunit CydC [Metallibacterium scheffleri]|uniref:Thiol reductant ABC exporter subunit CydC n=1 Tax=Metallibacterium scheffleri TaxID=993689 RepID=A0A4S3KPE4_9GAMM|nr:thiol reductant ABC exporter subunit CydC [Metallibacterium scheffleri]THD10865.1 thiol reductant ABC exporter subunit CydC [Metallibacterium scheffleri]